MTATYSEAGVKCVASTMTLDEIDRLRFRVEMIANGDVKDNLAENSDSRIVKNERVFVLRDDVVCGGTKARFLHRVIADDPKLSSAPSFGYNSSRYGSAAIVLAWTAKRLGKPVFLIEKKPRAHPLHANDQLAADLGATFVKSFASQKGIARLPSGFRMTAMEVEIAEFARRIRDAHGVFDQVWCVVATGALISGLAFSGLGRTGLGKHYYGVNVYPGSKIGESL